MTEGIRINGRIVGPGHPCYVVAEMSANHHHSYEAAEEIVRLAKEAGADAIKLQTYTPDTLTIDCGSEYFQIGMGTIWEGKNLYALYGEAYTPWEWHAGLQKLATSLGLDFFSTPFDASSIEFLEKLGVPLYKIASFELVDHELVKGCARTGKPVIMSTGMASREEIEESVAVAREAGCKQLALLKCTSAYPSPPEEMNLRTMPDLAERFGVVTGLSDHTMGIAVPVAAVALGASVIEKHFTRSRNDEGPDSRFSMEPEEFRAMVDAIRVAEAALGEIDYALTDKEAASRVFRRSLFVVEDVKEGEEFTETNLRSIRPGYGLAPKHLHEFLGGRASRDLVRGTPLDWDLLDK